MTRYVIDASVVLKWFAPAIELHTERALAVMELYVQKELSLVAPPLLQLEVVNVAARRWKYSQPDLRGAVEDLYRLELDVGTPNLHTIARWASEGLTAYDAAYVALAEESGLSLITADEQVLATASSLAIAPADWPQPTT